MPAIRTILVPSLFLFAVATATPSLTADWLTATGVAATPTDSVPTRAAAPAMRPVYVLEAPVDVDRHRPVIYPTTVAQPIYRSPYPYGYFGARRHRMVHWHHGYRQSFAEMRLK